MNAWESSAVNRLVQVLLLLVSVNVLTGCSLLEVKLESGVEPLPKEQINMRMFSREYSYNFYTEVESSADLIANDTDDVAIKSNTLMWKIYSEQSLQRAIFQASPIAAMIDTWVFTEQMNHYFTTGAGREVFGDHQHIAIEASQRLSARFAKTAKGFNVSNFKQHQKFVEQYVAKNPISDLTFSRTSAFNDWLEFSNISEFEAITTFGSMPEVMSDMSDRMAMTTQQMPKILGWKAELYALHSDVNAADVEKALTDISQTTVKFQALMEQTPELMTQLAADMRTELSPLIEQLSQVTDDKLMQLSKERASLALIITHEREALVQMIADERVAAVQDLDALSHKTVELVFQQITETIKSVIVYFILFLITVFFAPLGLGVWLGKRMATNKNNSVVNN
ncbi:chemotaxis protein [Shewanella japonica]|uniref:chemotaxis protein n=1 Tax=Shewanella japonica TaxID=93973 RepID=UPI0024948457|nr:chemotaxis protein [Shewanella japonica]